MRTKRRATILLRLGVAAAAIVFAAAACSAPSSDPGIAPTATETVPPDTPPAVAANTPESPDFTPMEQSVANRLELAYGWQTDFTQRTINLGEIDVLLPRDQIVPIDDPTFASASDPPSYMEAREPVIALEIGNDARAYPLAMLMWHEIVNDTVGGIPVTVTFCPLCNSALVFERTVDDHELDFGTTGALRNSDLIMWDRQTESWWQQITGEAIVGHYAGLEVTLQVRPSAIMAWETFAERHPQGKVLERRFDARGFPIRSYDLPPYAGYDSVDNTNPFAFTGPIDGRLPAAAKVLTIEHRGDAIAFPFTFLEMNPVLNDTVGDLAFTSFFDPETLSAFLDDREDPFASGSVTVFDRDNDGTQLEFEWVDGQVRDTNTGSTWSVAGVATSGPLSGSELSPVVHGEHFWFAWAVFRPGTELRGLE